MTQDEFLHTGWKAGMRATYKGEIYPVAACDFVEALIALDGVTLGTDEPTWVRCESVTLVAVT